jgi:hypothetical protein
LVDFRRWKRSKTIIISVRMNVSVLTNYRDDPAVFEIHIFLIPWKWRKVLC